MKEKYFDCVKKVSQIIFEEIKTKEDNLPCKIFEIDTDILSLLRAIGLEVMSMLLIFLSSKAVEQVKKPGWKIKRRPQIKYTTIFGELKIQSPYVWNKRLNKGIRPIAEFLGIKNGKYSIGLTKALTDFGAEESFSQASLRFFEHYGFKIEKSRQKPEVIKIAYRTENFIKQRLKSAENEPDIRQADKTEKILIELDGCHLRTGVKIPVERVELTKIRKIKQSSRRIDWRETRVAFARPLDDKQQRTFVAKMDKYPIIVQQLVGAAKDRGLFSGSQLFAVADGGNGLKESLENTFNGLQFILDYSHLKKHLFEAIDAMDFPKNRISSVKDIWLKKIASGQVLSLIHQLTSYQGPGAKKVKNLVDYLTRFKDCVHYDKFKSDGLPIGSGEVESSHKYIPQKRLKIAGATWHPDTINPMLGLRIIRANNWWSQFWCQYSKEQYSYLDFPQNDSNFNLGI